MQRLQRERPDVGAAGECRVERQQFGDPGQAPSITVPTLSRFSSSSGVSNMIARSQNERTTDVTDVSSSTAKHSVSELFPAEYSRNSEASAMIAAPDIQGRSG